VADRAVAWPEYNGPAVAPTLSVRRLQPTTLC
jgi:hypothetical protein